MNRFWDPIILPILQKINAEHVVEIGCDMGKNTRKILKYCINNGAKLSAIDPNPKFNVEEWKEQYGDVFYFYKELSLNALPLIKDYDAVLIDGDHNWYTVYNELKIIEKSYQHQNFPVIFLHDVSWPYGRRDLYYSPENIPEVFRQPYKKLGILPNQSSLVEKGGLNDHLYNAIYENNLKNGVLTAVEDFLKETNLQLCFKQVEGFHGLGIIYLENKELDLFINNLLKNSNIPYLLEKERIASIIKIKELRKIREDLNQKIQELKHEISTKDELIKELNLKQNELQEEIKKIEEKELNLEKNLVQKDKVLEELNLQNKKLQHKIQDLEQRELDLKKSLLKKDNIIEELNLQKKDLHNKFSNLKEREINLMKKVCKNKKIIRKLKRRENELTKEIKKLIDERERLKYEYQHKDNSLKRLDMQITELTNLIKEMEIKHKENYKSKIEELQKKDQLINDLKKEKTMLAKENEKLKRKIEEKSLTEKKLINQKQLLEKELNSTKFKLHEAEKAINVHLNSVRYKLGDSMIRALRPSRDTLLLPIRLVKLFNEGIRNIRERRNKRKNHNAKCNSKKNINASKFVSKKNQRTDKYNTNKDVKSNAFVDIIVCIHNALDDVKECLNSLYDKKTLPFNLIIVDDGSDKETRDFLKDFAKKVRAKLIRNNEARGYTIAANQGLRASKGDYVILLNSDTIVTRGWIEKLLDCFEIDEKTGIVGPLSNAASWQTVPEIMENGDWKVNQLPEGVNLELMSAIVENASCREFPKVPFVNGFCFMIKRDVINEIGYLDEKTFPKGYGEENDYCIRAIQAGFNLRIADHCYIFHEKSKSFTHEVRKSLSKNANKVLRQKYGDEKLDYYINMMKNNKTLPKIRNKINTLLKEFEDIKQIYDKSFLFLLPAKGGSGGANSVVQETIGLRELGLDVKIITKEKYLDRFLENYPEAESFYLSYCNEQDLIKKAVKFDVVIATIFTTVKILKKIIEVNPNIVPAYYIQDYEPWFFEEGHPMRQEAKESYNLIPNILAFAKTDWIRKMVKRHHNIDVHKVKPSLDTCIYNPYIVTTIDCNDKVEIVAMVRPKTPRRAARETLLVLRKVKEKFKDDVNISVFGCTDRELKAFGDIAKFEFNNFGILKRWEVADLLRKSDIFIDMSVYQAFGRTGLEAMALGCTVILPQNGGTTEYAINGENAFLIDTKDINSAVKAVERLILDKKLLLKFKREGIKTAKAYSIMKSSWSEFYVFWKYFKSQISN